MTEIEEMNWNVLLVPQTCPRSTNIRVSSAIKFVRSLKRLDVDKFSDPSRLYICRFSNRITIRHAVGGAHMLAVWGQRVWWRRETPRSEEEGSAEGALRRRGGSRISKASLSGVSWEISWTLNHMPHKQIWRLDTVIMKREVMRVSSLT
jgi:hypothetical protein